MSCGVGHRQATWNPHTARCNGNNARPPTNLRHKKRHHTWRAHIQLPLFDIHRTFHHIYITYALRNVHCPCCEHQHRKQFRSNIRSMIMSALTAVIFGSPHHHQRPPHQNPFHRRAFQETTNSRRKLSPCGLSLSLCDELSTVNQVPKTTKLSAYMHHRERDWLNGFESLCGVVGMVRGSRVRVRAADRVLPVCAPRGHSNQIDLNN